MDLAFSPVKIALKGLRRVAQIDEKMEAIKDNFSHFIPRKHLDKTFDKIQGKNQINTNLLLKVFNVTQ